MISSAENFHVFYVDVENTFFNTKVEIAPWTLHAPISGSYTYVEPRWDVLGFFQQFFPDPAPNNSSMIIVSSGTPDLLRLARYCR